jgi:hypothetical protein
MFMPVPLVARKVTSLWAGFMTWGPSGYHFTGEDDKCKVNYTYFICNHDSHDPKEMHQRKRGRAKIKREITHT